MKGEKLEAMDKRLEEHEDKITGLQERIDELEGYIDTLQEVVSSLQKESLRDGSSFIRYKDSFK